LVAIDASEAVQHAGGLPGDCQGVALELHWDCLYL
jgi:hypothetical protein